MTQNVDLTGDRPATKRNRVIEITPAMMKAGAWAFYDLFEPTGEDAAYCIFTAMIEAAPPSCRLRVVDRSDKTLP